MLHQNPNQSTFVQSSLLLRPCIQQQTWLLYMDHITNQLSKKNITPATLTPFEQAIAVSKNAIDPTRVTHPMLVDVITMFNSIDKLFSMSMELCIKAISRHLVVVVHMIQKWFELLSRVTDTRNDLFVYLFSCKSPMEEQQQQQEYQWSSTNNNNHNSLIFNIEHALIRWRALEKACSKAFDYYLIICADLRMEELGVVVSTIRHCMNQIGLSLNDQQSNTKLVLWKHGGHPNLVQSDSLLNTQQLLIKLDKQIQMDNNNTTDSVSGITIPAERQLFLSNIHDTHPSVVVNEGNAVM